MHVCRNIHVYTYICIEYVYTYIYIQYLFCTREYTGWPSFEPVTADTWCPWLRRMRNANHTTYATALMRRLKKARRYSVPCNARDPQRVWKRLGKRGKEGKRERWKERSWQIQGHSFFYTTSSSSQKGSRRAKETLRNKIANALNICASRKYRAKLPRETLSAARSAHTSLICEDKHAYPKAHLAAMQLARWCFKTKTKIRRKLD